MGEVVVSEFVTLDGVMEAPEWSLSYFDSDAGAFKNEELFAADTLLLGRVTFEQMADAWPSRTDDYGYADRINSLPKFVVSSTLQKPLPWNATLLEGDLAAAVRGLKERFDNDILVFGSADLVGALAREGLVDEYRLMMFPVVLGSGKRLFPDGLDVADLQLAGSKLTSSGIAILSYRA